MVRRIYVEKRKEFAAEAAALLSDAVNLLGIGALEDVRLVKRYDAENIDDELFDHAVSYVFSEPQTDIAFAKLDTEGASVFAVEYLPGQFDQRADSAAQCIQIISKGERPLIHSATVYILYGDISQADIDAIKHYVINPVEAREASLELPETLKTAYAIPESVELLDGFIEYPEDSLEYMLDHLGLAMDLDDLKFCQQYFNLEGRDPTITEIRMIDTYWSDHCRHTTFSTIIDDVEFEDELLKHTFDDYLLARDTIGRTKPICLMDVATIAVKYLKANGLLEKLDESDEINACTVKIQPEIDGETEDWLLLFKNETHNHPTEIEPFGGAATCIGGAIRDPLSGRAYVYGAMRITGAADPTVPIGETMKGKLPQRSLVTKAAAGYSSYGNQIGLTTGIVDEIYHPGYAAKHMELGAVVGAVPERNVRRETPAPGDVVIYLGGSTGRDGIGGATGSSKAHDSHSVESCGAEVQKGNAPEERKLQRLFRNGDATRMIKRCNDFGAGGVSVAIGELAPGLLINLNAVPKKYDGLDGTELAISESQERMACVVALEDKDAFIALAEKENLRALEVARVTDSGRLVMEWNGEKIVDISRKFLDSNGAEKHITVEAAAPKDYSKVITGDFKENYEKIVNDLNICSRRGLSERFDSTIGAGTVLMPFGGKNQLTPIQAMVQKISVEKGHTDECSLMAWGYNPFIMEKSPFHGAYLAVIESVCKLVAAGADFDDVYLTFQEYFEKLGKDPKRWGKPLSALLGALRAQLDLEIGAIGGKDSMSGSFEDLDVPPTLVSIAVTTQNAEDIISPEFKEAGHKVVLLEADKDEDGIFDPESLRLMFSRINFLIRAGVVKAAYTPGMGGIAEAVFKMAIGNGIGFEFDSYLELDELFEYKYGAFLLEVPSDFAGGTVIGVTIDKPEIWYDDDVLFLSDLLGDYEGRLEGVYPCNIPEKKIKTVPCDFSAAAYPSPALKCAKPRVLIPVFPGTNCEYDSAKCFADAGADPQVMVIKNLTRDGIARSVEEFAKEIEESQIIFIPGGFSGGDEPDGSGKFITAFFRNEEIKEGVMRLLNERDGLMAGICNGFQALIKLGLVPYGKIIDTDESCPTLTFNDISRHQSRIVRTRISSNLSPWFKNLNVGDIINVPISHGEGKFIASEELIASLAANGQIAAQYVDLEGHPTGDVHFNPNGSAAAIECITSPDGRILGKMGHSERKGSWLYKNVPGEYDNKMFASAVEYFR